MTAQDTINFGRISNAIGYIQANFQSQPSLEEIAEAVHLSPFHFQKLFTSLVGTSPKQFLQYTNLGYAKTLLKHKQASLFDIAEETGYSSPARLHDLFIKIEGMTPGEYKNGGKDLFIKYSFSQTIFGKILVASTGKGICKLVFVEEKAQGIEKLKYDFPEATITNETDSFQLNALRIFSSDWTKLPGIKLHLRGTDFQLKVWEVLLKIPFGQVSTYGGIAEQIENPKACRAVGTAIGDNPIAFLIPCHRVIQSSGALGGYMWGTAKKVSMIGWEAALTKQGSLSEI